MFKNGIYTGKEIGGVPFYVDLIPKSNKTSRPQIPMEAENTTVHTTGNTARGSNAKMHTTYVDNVDGYISWHFTVGDDAIYQELPINEVGWHAGDGRKGPGNRTSIGVEICVNEDGDFAKAIKNAYNLFILLEKHDAKLGILYPHQKWSGKYCPRQILDKPDGFEGFVRDYKEYKEKKEKGEVVKLQEWQEDALQWAVANKVSDGTRPLDNVTRVEVMKMIKNMTENFEIEPK